jgi:hypothetical protein
MPAQGSKSPISDSWAPNAAAWICFDPNAIVVGTEHQRAWGAALRDSAAAALGMLDDSSTAQQLASLGPPTAQKVKQQLNNLLSAAWAAEAAAAVAVAKRKGKANAQGKAVAAVFDGLRQELQATGVILSTLAVPVACNNPSCINMAGPSELLLVSGRSCVCGGCKVNLATLLTTAPGAASDSTGSSPSQSVQQWLRRRQQQLDSSSPVSCRTSCPVTSAAALQALRGVHDKCLHQAWHSLKVNMNMNMPAAAATFRQLLPETQWQNGCRVLLERIMVVFALAMRQQLCRTVGAAAAEAAAVPPQPASAFHNSQKV